MASCDYFLTSDSEYKDVFPIPSSAKTIKIFTMSNEPFKMQLAFRQNKEDDVTPFLYTQYAIRKYKCVSKCYFIGLPDVFFIFQTLFQTVIQSWWRMKLFWKSCIRQICLLRMNQMRSQLNYMVRQVHVSRSIFSRLTFKIFKINQFSHLLILYRWNSTRCI